MPTKKRASSPTGGSSKAPSSKLNQPRSSGANADGNDSDEFSGGEFEDKWEDEFESEDEVEADNGEGDEEVDEAGNKVSGMDLDGQEEEPESMPYLPQLGQGEKELAEDEELVPDLTSYVVLHHAGLKWPCLSFDTLRDVSS